MKKIEKIVVLTSPFGEIVSCARREPVFKPNYTKENYQYMLNLYSEQIIDLSKDEFSYLILVSQGTNFSEGVDPPETVMDLVKLSSDYFTGRFYLADGTIEDIRLKKDLEESNIDGVITEGWGEHLSDCVLYELFKLHKTLGLSLTLEDLNINIKIGIDKEKGYPRPWEKLDEKVYQKRVEYHQLLKSLRYKEVLEGMESLTLKEIKILHD